MTAFIPRWSIQVTGKSQKRDVIAYQIRQSFKLLHHNGEYYIVSPYSLVWDGDYYYVVGYSEMREKIQNFRLDRIYRTPELLCKNYIMNAVADLLPMGIRLGRGYEDPRSGEREGEI